MKTDIKCPHCGKEIKIDGFLEKARTSIKQEVQQESLLKLLEKEKVISDLRLKLDDAKRTAEQGSMQLQGEVQELEIIKVLRDLYPFDEINQSKKGTNAADVLQIIKTQNGVISGKIYYESKNCRQWSNSWIPKLKKDNLVSKADVLVIVSSVLPKDVYHFGLIDGVWVVAFDYFKELSIVLRHNITKLHAITIRQEGKDSKMGQLYSYLTSNDFRGTFETIVNRFHELRMLHDSEKTNMLRAWKKRELAFAEIFSSAVEMHGTIKDIAGSAISSIPMLELQQSI